MYESDIIRSFEHYLNRNRLPYAKELNLENYRIDIVYIDKKNDIVAIEAKGDVSEKEIRNALYQAFVYKKIADRVYLLMPSKIIEKLDGKLANKMGIGIKIVLKNGEIKELIPSIKNRPEGHLKEIIRNKIRDNNQEVIERYYKRDTKTVNISRFFKMLSKKSYFELLKRLCKHEYCVNTLVEELNMDQPFISHSLAELREYGIIDFKSQGRNKIYFIPSEEMIDFINELEKIILNMYEED
jgi:DNA-binding transcriptional ArsR family regulator